MERKTGENFDEKTASDIFEKLKNVEGKDRTAFYECDICFYDGTEPQFFIGKCYGTLGYERKGVNGFGYDPLFIYEGKTFAEVDLETKNKVSHRALALKEFIKYFEIYLFHLLLT